MKKISFLLSFILLFTLTSIAAQNTPQKKKQLTGKVTDYNNKPIKGARIFIDSLKTKVKTNKKGTYSVMVKPDSKIITIFSEKHGIIDMEYKGQDNIDFVFSEQLAIISKKELLNLGYGTDKYEDENDYASYSDIFQLLKVKFHNVEVNGESIRIRGASKNMSGGISEPLFIVNGTTVTNISNILPVNIESITVERANSNLYGSRGAGGIIKIKLKK